MIGAWMLALMATSPAYGALNRPSDATIATMSADCDRLMALQIQLKIDSDAFLLLQRKAGFFESGRYYLSRLSSSELTDIASRSRKIGDARKEANDLAADLLVRTLRAYGISDPNNPRTGDIRSGPPDRPNAPNAMTSYLGQTATFRPKFDATRPLGSPAITLNDGTLRIGWGAFTYPGKLASILYHEQQHFNDLLAPNKDLRNDAEIELRIRSSQRDAFLTVFQLRPRDMADYDTVLAKLPAAKSKWAEKMAEGWDPYREDHWRGIFKPILKEALPTHSAESGGQEFNMPEGLDEIRQRAALLDILVQNEQEARRSAAERPGTPPAQGAPWRQYHALKSTARSLCESIDYIQPWFGTIHDWTAGLKLVPDTFYVRNLDAVSQTFPCEEYVMFQGIYAFRKSYDVSDLEFLTRLVREGKVRETDSRPYQGRVTPAPSQPSPTTPPPAAPATPPNTVDPEPRPTRPEPGPPAIPHCRYHPWCKE